MGLWIPDGAGIHPQLRLQQATWQSFES